MTDVERVAATDDLLACMPFWCDRGQVLWWADGFGAALHRLDPITGAVASDPVPEKFGSFALREAGGLLLAGRSGLALFDPATGAFEVIGDPKPDPVTPLLNDGAVDAAGRFWVGSMDRRLTQTTAELFRVDVDHGWRAMQSGFYLANSLAFAPDGSWMTLACSHQRLIWRFALDLASGELGAASLFADTRDLPGVPDGATVDTEGCLWVARFGAGLVVRYTPAGAVERVLELPVRQVTACAFGGDDLRTLYVTTATFRMNEAQRHAEPLAGSLLALRPGAQGIPPVRYRG